MIIKLSLQQITPMRRNEKEITDPEIINKWLQSAHVCRVAINDTTYPYVVPMNYGYHDNALYFHCALEGKKLELIKKNPNVGFEITLQDQLYTGPESCNWTTHFQSLFGYGKMEILESPEDKIRGLDILMKQHGKELNKYNIKVVERMLVLKLEIIDISAKQAGKG